jgi:hypothetical protein
MKRNHIEPGKKDPVRTRGYSRLRTAKLRWHLKKTERFFTVCLVCCCSYYQYVCLPPCLLSFCQALVCLSVILSILLLFCLPLAVCRLLCLSFTFSLTYHACRFPAYTSISVYYLGLSLSSAPSFCYSPFYLSCLLLSCLSVRLPAVLTICVSVMLLVCLSAILSIL